MGLFIPAGSIDAIRHYKNRRTTILLPAGTGGTVTIWGDSANLTGGASTVLADANNAVHIANNTGAVGSADAGYSGNGNYRIGDNRNAHFTVRVKLPSVAAIRMFLGLSSGSLVSMVGSNDPAGNYVGFQFSTPRGDTNIQCISKNNVTQGVTNSNVAADTNEHLYHLECVDASGKVDFYIDGVLRATRTTLLPAASNALYIFAIETEDGTNKIIETAGMEVSVDK
jgi:hypothetical protein